MEGIGKKTLKTLKTKKLAAKQQEKEKYKGLGSKSESEKYSNLASKSDKEMEIEKGLSAEEQAAYERLEKQGMSDQGIVSPKELKQLAKDIYSGVKSKTKKLAGKAKEILSKTDKKNKENK
jgi:hypothetical protein